MICFCKNASFFAVLCLAFHFRALENSSDPDQTPRSAPSDHGLHCLHARISIQTGMKMKQIP